MTATDRPGPPPSSHGDGPGTRPLRLGSMCTGYGGLDMAIAQVLDVEPAWVADPDPGAAAILAHRMPDVPNLGDITKVTWEDAVRVEVLAAGFPCTDLSFAGLGAGIRKGTRSGLWFTIADAIDVLRPGLVILENVRAIVTRRPGLDVVLADLARLGFDAVWTCNRASDVGAPHRRERWFLVAHPADQRHQWGRLARGRRPGSTDGGVSAADAFGGELQRRRVAGVVGGQESAERREGHQRERDGHAAGHRGEAAADAQGAGPQGPRPQSEGRGPERGGRAAADTDGGGRRTGPGLLGGERAAERLQGDLPWGDYGPAVRRWEAALGRPAPDPTEPGRDDKPRLSPAFVEWLMGLPDGHVTAVPGLSRSRQLHALGNGVVPQQGAAALAHLLDRIAGEAAA